MAITQNRMLALIEAADGFKEKVLEVEKMLTNILQELPPNPTLEDCLKTIESIHFYKKHILLNAAHVETLATERAHFAANATRNIRHANRAKRKREGDAITSLQRSTAPDRVGKAPKPFKTIFEKWEGIEAHIHGLDESPFGAVRKPLPPMNNELIRQKIEINKLYQQLGQPEPYPDFVNDEEPLQDEHKRHFGMEIESKDEGLF